MNSTLVLSGIMLLTGLSVGSIAPAANNACIELMPNRVGTITGIRGMFRQVGGAISVSITALLLNNAGDINRGFRLILLGFMVLMLVSLPVILLVPKNAEAKVVALNPQS